MSVATNHLNPHLDEEKTITMLENSIYYFLETVFIIINNDRCRLIVTHQRNVLTDCSYSSLRGAKIAFSRMYQDKAWKPDIKAVWTHKYPADIQWLTGKLPTPEARPH